MNVIPPPYKDPDSYFSKRSTAESIELFIGDQAFSTSYDLAPLPSPSRPSVSFAGNTQKDWEC